MLGPRPVDSLPQPQPNYPSTKHLIQRFESLRQPSRSSSRRVSEQRADLPRSKEVQSSFQNLFGLLKKGASKFNLTVPASREPSPSPMSISDLVNSVRGSRQDKHTKGGGALLYLDQSSTVPIWVSCSAVIGDETLAVSSFTAQANSRVQSISLLGCTDVRSLTPEDLLDSDGFAILPQTEDADRIQVFELVFDSGVIERFAAFSVKDRAGWVNAIWDAILSLRGARKSQPPPRALPLLPVTSKHGPSSPPGLDIAPALPLKDTAAHNEILLEASSVAELEQASWTHVTSPSWDARVTTPIMSPPMTLDSLDSTPKGSSSDRHNPNQHSEDERRPSIPETKQPSIADRYLVARSHAGDTVAAPADPGLISLLGTLQSHVLHQFDLCTTINAQLSTLQGDMEKQRVICKKSAANTIQDTDRSHIELNEKLDTILAKLELCYGRLDGETRAWSNSKLAIRTQEGNQITQLSETLESIKTLMASDVAAIMNRLTEKEDVQIARLSELETRHSGAPLLRDTSELCEQTIHLTQLVNAVKQQGDSQLSQAADNARYLNELNSWLESFVTRGMSQIESIACSVDYLCRQLSGDSTGALPGTVFQSVRQLAYEVEVREKSNSALYDAINSLSAGINSRDNSSMMAGQHQWMDTLIRKATFDIIEEVRGERIRFVDAMKEATAINVQAHVEQFKQDLKEEVRSAANEISQLYQEKEQLEGRLGELTSLLARQHSLFAPHQPPPSSRVAGIDVARGPSPS